ncbi:dystroglycan, partial [Biomphalaria pfeifferi]
MLCWSVLLSSVVFILRSLARAQVADDLDLPDVLAPVGRVFSLNLGTHPAYGSPSVSVS